MEDSKRTRVRQLVVQRLESLQRAGVTSLPRSPATRLAVAGEGVSREGEAREGEAREGEAREGEAPAEPRRTSNIGHRTLNTDIREGEAREGEAPAELRRTSNIGHQTLNSEPEVPPRTDAEREQRVAALADMGRDVAACRRCTELASTRTQTVFGVGNPMPRLVFLGEAPGADEDRQGEPFVGRAGQLLNKILAACTLRREDVYILNILKCRPPGNRNPAPEEAANCREYLLRQLGILQPEYICCLGAVAAQSLLETTTPIGQLRGRFHEFQGMRVVATYHPAYLLRNPAAKRATWDDMKMLLREMGIEIPDS